MEKGVVELDEAEDVRSQSFPSMWGTDWTVWKNRDSHRDGAALARVVGVVPSGTTRARARTEPEIGGTRVENDVDRLGGGRVADREGGDVGPALNR